MLLNKLVKIASALAFLSQVADAKLKGSSHLDSLNKVDRVLPTKEDNNTRKDPRKKYNEDPRIENTALDITFFVEEDNDEDEEEFYCPAERYIQWSDLPANVDTDYLVASQIQLHYGRDSWNQFSSPVEEMSFDALYEDMAEAAETMGYNEDRWDCCLNHYTNYDYDELGKEGYAHLEIAYTILGWHSDNWEDGQEPPLTEQKDWEDLIALEQTAADYLCYDENSWDGEPLPWSDDDVESPPAEMDFECPGIRYVSWSQLRSQERYAALDLGYSEFSWNNFEDPIEELSFEEVNSERDWRQALTDLGYEEQTWDCCINNYRSYEYSELTEDKSGYAFLQYAVNVLGWTEQNWGSDNPDHWPRTEFKKWDELSDFEKAAADYLCYYEESWNDEETLEEIEEELEEEVKRDEEDQ